MVTVEVCVESTAGVRAARAAGAARVELCGALVEGGLTPSAGALAAAVAVGGIEVVVLVRPRAGDFLYSEEELAVLERDIDEARARGAAGVALGCLTAEGQIDAARCARLVERARPLPVTFHRAFDGVREPERGLATLIELGFARVLSSGQAESALAGRERLKALVRAAGERIAVIAAGGVRAENVTAIVAATGVRAVHLSASLPRSSAMRYRNPRARLAPAERPPEDAGYFETDAERLRALFESLHAAGL